MSRLVLTWSSGKINGVKKVVASSWGINTLEKWVLTTMMCTNQPLWPHQHHHQHQSTNALFLKSIPFPHHHHQFQGSWETTGITTTGITTTTTARGIPNSKISKKTSQIKLNMQQSVSVCICSGAPTGKYRGRLDPLEQPPIPCPCWTLVSYTHGFQEWTRALTKRCLGMGIFGS